MTPSKRIAASLTTLFTLPALSGGCQTWRSASRESLLEVASQPNVEHRILTVPGAPDRLGLAGNVAFRLHTSAGVVGPFASRDLHFEGGLVVIYAPGSATIQLEPGQIHSADLAMTYPESRFAMRAVPYGTSGLTWRAMSGESVVDLARQPNVEHRVLETPTGPDTIAINGDTPVRIHTVDRVLRPLASRYLHSSGDGFQITSPAAPPVQLDPVGADFRVADPGATTDLVLGITIPVALVFIVACVVLGESLQHGVLNFPPGTL